MPHRKEAPLLKTLQGLAVPHPMKGHADARTAIAEAIKLHQAHMDGTAPTSPASQKKLMVLLEEAAAGLKEGASSVGAKPSMEKQ